MTVYQTQTDLFITTATNSVALTLAMEFILLNLLNNPAFQSKITKSNYAKDLVLYIFLAETKITL